MERTERFEWGQEFTNPELEAELLQRILDDPETYLMILDWAGNPSIWAIYRDAFEDIADQLSKNEKPQLPTQLAFTPSGLSPLEIAKELAALYEKRQAVHTLQHNLIRLYQEELPANELLAQVEQDLHQAKSNIKALDLGKMEFVTDVMGGILEDLQQLHDALRESKSNIVGLPTGIKELDKHLGGLQAGIHLLAAEPGAGKTTLALQFARNVAKNGIPAVFITFEETTKRLIIKNLCALGDKHFKRYAEGWGKPQDLAKVYEEHKSLLSNMCFIQGRKDLSVAEVQAKVMQVLQKTKAERCLVVVDYLQRWAAHYQSLGDFRFVVRKLAADLREMSLRYNIPLLVISSQNRSGQGEAKLSSFKESGDLEYDADSALFLVKDKTTIVGDGEKAIDLKILKNRYGEADRTIKLTFFGAKGYFVEPIQ